MSTQSQAEWLTATDAARLLGTNRQAVARMAERGLIRKRDLPVRNRFLAADVQRLAQSPEHVPQ